MWQASIRFCQGDVLVPGGPVLPYHARMYLSLSAVSLEGMSPYEERYGDTFKKQNFPKALLEKIVRTVFSK